MLYAAPEIVKNSVYVKDVNANCQILFNMQTVRVFCFVLHKTLKNE